MRRRTLFLKKDYLEVAPVEPQWIDVGSDIIYQVSANVSWLLK